MDRVRVRAPELRGAGGWIGVDELSLAALRGRIVLLDFWTLACANCQRVLEELRGLERRFAGTLVVIGVHAPKFPHEHEHAAVRAAVARHRIEHPVLDDSGSETWDAYAVRAWPTLVLIDAQGRVALTVSGEGHAVELASAIEELVAEAGDGARVGVGVGAGAGAGAGAAAVLVQAVSGGTGELAFPGKVAVEEGVAGPRLAIADSGHDRVLVCTLDGDVVASLDGLYQPQGVRFDGDALLVCEAGADRVWRIGLGAGAGRALISDRIASPMDVVRWQGHLVVAEAGRHRLWALDRAGELQVIAGTGAEGLHDGAALQAALAQPSGLAVTAGGDLAFVDAEAGALRVLRASTLAVQTLVGAGLFDWGEDDGDRGRARMQHPLGVAAAPDGALYVADTFNGAIRVWRGTHLWTVPVAGFDEPGGLAVAPGGRLVVADTGNHRIVFVDPVSAAAVALGVPAAVAEAVVAEAGSALEVPIELDLGGDALDGAGAVRVWASASDPALLRGPASWTLPGLPATVALALGTGSGRITVEVRAATCGPDACRLRRTQRAYDVLLT